MPEAENRNGSLPTSENIYGNKNVSAPNYGNRSVSAPKYGHGKGRSIGFGNYFRKYDHANIQSHGYLPHWEQEGVIIFVTFRLKDSLPQYKLKEFMIEKEEWFSNHPKPWSSDEIEEYNELFDSIDEWLDQGYGECILAYKAIQDIMEDTLNYYDGKKYELYDYIIMPNHIHLLLIPGYGYELKSILKSIKGYSANAINKLLGRKGKIWQKESWDRLIRSHNDFINKVEYIKHNGEYSRKQD